MRRPLNKNQIKYAANDVIYLEQIYTKILSKLKNDNKYDWLIEEQKKIRINILYKKDENNSWEKIKLSDNAATRIKEIMTNAQKDSIGVRIGVKTGGCAGMSYVMEYAKDSNPNDEVIEDKGVKVFVDAGAVMYLLGTEMDYKKEELSSSFVFKNPNETERCGCGESFKL